MFTLTDVPVKFVGLLIFFAWTTCWGLVELRRKQDAKQYVSNGLHLMMSLVMLAMVARTTWRPLHAIVPLPAFVGLFSLSTLWFVALAMAAWRRRTAAGPSLVPHFVGHAMMMGAMTWHLSAMMLKMSHMGPGMMKWQVLASKPGGALWTVALIGVIFMTYLLLAGIWDLVQALRPVSVEHGRTAHRGAVVPTPVLETAGCHDPRPVGSLGHRLSRLSGSAMNLGMFWMSTGLMTALLPAMKYLSF